MTWWRGSLALSALWVALAVWQPTTTWHLAPLLIAIGSFAVSDSTLDLRRVVKAGGLALAGSVAVTGLVGAIGALEGPSLLPWGDATLEATVFALRGFALGWVWWAVRSSRDAASGDPRHRSL